MKFITTSQPRCEGYFYLLIAWLRGGQILARSDIMEWQATMTPTPCLCLPSYIVIFRPISFVACKFVAGTCIVWFGGKINLISHWNIDLWKRHVFLFLLTLYWPLARLFGKFGLFWKLRAAFSGILVWFGSAPSW